MKNIGSIEMAEKTLVDLLAKTEKTQRALELIPSVPDGVSIRVRPGSITFKIDNDEVSFKSLADDLRSKFRVSLDKDFNETKGNYSLIAKTDEGVTLKIVDISAPQGCEIRLQEVQEVKKKKRFLPFGTCGTIIR